MNNSKNCWRGFRKAGVVTAVTAGMLFTAACGGSDSDDESGQDGGGGENQAVSLMLDWAWSPYHAPFMYGVEKGIYADEGLDVELIQGQGSGTVSTLIGQDEYDFGFVNLNAMMTAASEDVPVKSVLTINKDSMYGTICHEISGWDGTASDLSGRSVLLVPTAGEAQIWDAYLALNDLTPDDVTVVNAKPENKVSLFLAERADCMVGLLALEILQAQGEASGPLTEATPWSEEGVELFGFGIASNSERVADQPEVTQQFVDATVASWQQACDDTEGAMAIYEEKVPEANRTEEQKEFNTASFEELCEQAQNRTPAFGPTEEGEWEAALSLLKEYSGVDTDEPVTTFFTNDFVS